MKNRINIVSSFLVAVFCFVAVIGTNAQSINQQIARGNFLKSLPNFQDAAKIVIGREKSESELSQYFSGLFAIKYGMKKVINSDEAISYLKEYAAQPNNSNLRRQIVENIYWDARGRKPTNDEYAGFDTLIKLQKTWYIKEMLNQAEFLKNPAYKSEKYQMVNLAYKSALCRDARSIEADASTANLYVNEIDNLRNLIWSPSYTALRNETIRLWWQNKFKQKPTPANLQVAIEKFEPVKAICSEMSKRWDYTDIK